MSAVSGSTETALRRRRKLLGSPYRLFYQDPVELVRGEGPGSSTRLAGATWTLTTTFHVSDMRIRRVVAALSAQAALINTHTRYLSELTLDYAERLLATLPDTLGHVMFTCSGSEANDLALQIARHWTGNTGVIVTDNAYHGTDLGRGRRLALTASLAPGNREVELVKPPAAGHATGEEVEAFAGRVASAASGSSAEVPLGSAARRLGALKRRSGPRTGRFLRAAADAVRAAGGVYIADEVQAGFGRTGRMWGFERHGAIPDIVTMGKPMGNGYPLAGLAARGGYGRFLRRLRPVLQHVRGDAGGGRGGPRRP